MNYFFLPLIINANSADFFIVDLAFSITDFASSFSFLVCFFFLAIIIFLNYYFSLGKMAHHVYYLIKKNHPNSRMVGDLVYFATVLIIIPIAIPKNSTSIIIERLHSNKESTSSLFGFCSFVFMFLFFLIFSLKDKMKERNKLPANYIKYKQYFQLGDRCAIPMNQIKSVT